jgi:hypothetical protein
LTLEADAIDHMIDANVRAPYHAAVEVARKMPDNGRIYSYDQLIVLNRPGCLPFCWRQALSATGTKNLRWARLNVRTSSAALSRRQRRNSVVRKRPSSVRLDDAVTAPSRIPVRIFSINAGDL